MAKLLVKTFKEIEVRLIIIWVSILVLVGGIFAADPNLPDDWADAKTSRIEAGRNTMWYYSGQDTLAPVDNYGATETGYDTTFSTGLLQIAWSDTADGYDPDTRISGDENYTYNERMQYLCPRYVALWIMQDTTTFSHTDSSYGDVCDGDSAGFEAPTITFYGTKDDILNSYTAIMADSSQDAIGDDNYSRDDYGTWSWTHPFPLEALAASPIGKWYMFYIRVPVGVAFIDIAFNSENTMLETPVVRWRLCCAY